MLHAKRENEIMKFLLANKENPNTQIAQLVPIYRDLLFANVRIKLLTE